MPRPTTDRVLAITDELRRDVVASAYRRGDAFPSTRALAKRHGVSYQTAHRILARLVDEGLLVTRQGAGTFVAAGRDRPRHALLRFHERAKRRRSFGSHLKALLEAQLNRRGVPLKTAWTAPAASRLGEPFPVMWEPSSDRPVPGGSGADRFALILNDHRVRGMEATRVDTISVDDYSGGACAAQIAIEQLADAGAARRRLAILAADEQDARSSERVAGFRSVLPIAGRRVVYAGGWTERDAAAAAEELLGMAADCVFCCNDRLAEGLLRGCRHRRVIPPAVIGFDNAPVAEEMGITTIGIPWREIVSAATDVVVKRLDGDRSAARRQVFAPQPVLRASHRPPTGD